MSNKPSCEDSSVFLLIGPLNSRQEVILTVGEGKLKHFRAGKNPEQRL
jgi:hypothetical protein